eukprot:jgi/Mesen1/486/ME001024S10717
MSFMKGDLLSRMRLLIKGGIRERPVWMTALEKIPPEPKQKRCKKAPKIRMPEDPLVESYYARHPEAKMIPFKVRSYEPPPARRFAWRQLELMEQGIDKRKAMLMVEEEFAAEEEQKEELRRAERRKALREGRKPPPLRRSIVEDIQEAEEEVMKLSLEVVGSRTPPEER